jgi:lysophospholipase L1-like esterase
LLFLLGTDFRYLVRGEQAMRCVWRRLAAMVCIGLHVLGVFGDAPLSSAQEAAPPNRFEKDIAAYEAQDQKQRPPEGATLFVGSSSIRLWDVARWFPGAAVINRGFGGSQLADSVHFAPRIVVPYKPAKVVLYAGDNDLAAGKTPQQVFADYRAFVELVQTQLPAAEVIYIGIKPSVARWKLIEQGRETNRLIQEFAAQHPRLKFVDVGPAMLDGAGQPRKELFRADGLHLTDEGYQVWTDLLKPHLP